MIDGILGGGGKRERERDSVYNIDGGVYFIKGSVFFGEGDVDSSGIGTFFF